MSVTDGPESGPQADDPDPTPGSFEALAAEVLPRLLGASGSQLELEVHFALRRLIEFFDVDRSTILRLDSQDGAMSFGYSLATGAARPLRALDAQPYWLEGQIQRGEVLRLERLPDGVPEDAVTERRMVIELGLKSILVVPVPIEGRNVCALTVGAVRRHHRWTDLTVQRVRFFGELLGSTIHRCRQNEALLANLEQIKQLNDRLDDENIYLREELNETLPFHGIVSESPAMKRVLAQVQQVADTDSTVLILGETGTGKELVARAIHDRSRRSQRPLVKINCAALPAGLVESELFGYEKGAFTGALSTKPGRFEVADGGTLFLDEIGDLPLDQQAKLLRVLQEGELERLGSTRTRKVDVRIVAATNRALHEDARAGRFRSDLFYRLGVFIITIPPLRERREDIEPLVKFVIARRLRALNRVVRHVPSDALARLRTYDWPGNIRELENLVERALILSSGEMLALDEAFQHVPTAAAAPPEPAEDLESIERAHITAVLETCDWRIEGAGRAAERLNLFPSTLRSRMKKLGIQRPRSTSAQPPRAVGSR